MARTRARTGGAVTKKAVRQALDDGRREADRVWKQRRAQLRRRNQAVQARLEATPKPKAKRAKVVGAAMQKRAVAHLGPHSPDVLVAEGDSWFDYPMHDLLSILEDDHGYDVASVAHKGDRVENMAYQPGQLDAFTRRVQKVHRDGRVPKAILISGGGNDVAGTPLEVLVNHARSSIAGLNQSVMQGVVHERTFLAYVTILGAITEVSTREFGSPLPILIHGYDYPVPDGRGFLGGWGPLPGPWLQPGFRSKGFASDAQGRALAKQLIDEFNDMLQMLPVMPDFTAHVQYVDLRGTLRTGPATYRDDWANELHPTGHGFELIAAKFDEVLRSL